MNASIFQFRKHSFFTFLLSLCISFGMACPVHLLLGLTPRPLLVLATALAVSAGFFLLKGIRPLRILPYPLTLLAMGVIIFTYRTDADAFSSALVLAANGDLLPLSVWSYPLTILLTLLISAVGNAIAASDNPVFAILLLLILLFFPIALHSTSLSSLWLLPLVFALLLACRDSNTRYYASILSALAILVLTILLYPLIPKSQPGLVRTAETVRQAIDDYLFFTEARTPFSLSSTGWQPLGQNRIGGTVNPKDTKVMQVRTSGPTLLRGGIRNEYNGFAWADTIGGRRYLFVDPRFRSMRSNLFDAERPEASIAAGFPASELIQVFLEQDATSTLYLTQRFESLSGQNIVPYFSPASEVFTTRSLEAGSQYDFYGTRITAGTAGIRDLVLRSATLPDPWYEETIREEYLTLPDIVESGVYELAAEITSSARTDFDRALALTSYLAEHYPYSLVQNTPPTDRDFVSWFLFDEQRGYCTSFASSLVVMARAVGLPSRYVEGYSVVPGENGIAYVTQKNAHTWCEIYFTGFGWLPFDATPGLNNTENDQSPPDDAQSTPTPSPVPSPTPAPTPTPETDESPAPTDTPTPEPSPETSATPEPTATPEPEPEENRNPFLFRLVLILLILLLLAACIALRLSLTSPAYVADRQKERRNALLVYYAAILQQLDAMHITPQPGEAPATFLIRAADQLQISEIRKAASGLSAAGYSRKKPSRQDYEQMVVAFETISGLMHPAARLRLIRTRLIHGLSLKSLA